MKKILLSVMNIMLLSVILRLTAFAAGVEKGFVIVDARGLLKTTNRIYSFDASDSKFFSELKNIGNGDDLKKVIDDKILNQRINRTTDRIISKPGDTITVLLLYSDGTIEGLNTKDPFHIKFEEKEKKAQIIEDLVKLYNFLPIEVGVAVKKEEYKLIKKEYTLTKEMATLAVQIYSVPASATASEDLIVQTTLKTGIPEHWFLSADLKVTNAYQIKYDSATGILQEKQYPNSFYIAINYKIGDLLSKSSNFLDKIVLKVLLRPSNKQDSFGFGFGYRGPINILGFKIDAETASPFIAALWAKDDIMQNGVLKTDAIFGKVSIVAVLSFNLDKLSDWLKK